MEPGGRSVTTPWFNLRQLDAVDFLRALPDGSVDLVITDPAYESLEKHRAKGTTTRLSHSAASSNDWFAIFKNERYPEFFAELFRALRWDRHAYVLCDLDTAKVIDPIAIAAGFTVPNWLVWDKCRIGMGYHYRRKKEFILFLEKGDRKLADLGMADILPVPMVTGGYPTEKPVDLLAKLVAQSAAPGEVVTDPFFGSGSTGVAALEAGSHFLGNDLAQAAHDYARPRLAELGTEVTDPPLTGQLGLLGGAR